MMKYYSFKYKSPLGELTINASEDKILEILLPGQVSRLVTNEWHYDKNSPIVYAFQWLDDYFSGNRPIVDAHWISLRGTKFQLQVWQILTQIPYGQTVTYGQIATEICQQNQIQRMSAQAVGQAVGKNPIAIMIPCHRVVGAANQLTGYAGGVDKKIILLQHEGALR